MNKTLILFFIALCGLSKSAFADNFYKLIGASKTHLALREYTSGSDCCGADPIENCKYPGLKSMSGVTLQPTTGKPNKLRVQGISLVFIKMPTNEWSAEIEEGKNPNNATFVIYKPVSNLKECTHQDWALKQLAKAKDYSKSVGIDLGREDQINSKIIFNTHFALEACLNKSKPKFCDNPYFNVRSEDPDAGFNLKWTAFKIKNPVINLYRSTAALNFSSLRQYNFPELGLELYELGIGTTGISGIWESPRFLAHLAK